MQRHIFYFCDFLEHESKSENNFVHFTKNSPIFAILELSDSIINQPKSLSRKNLHIGYNLAVEYDIDSFWPQILNQKVVTKSWWNLFSGLFPCGPKILWNHCILAHRDPTSN